MITTSKTLFQSSMNLRYVQAIQHYADVAQKRVHFDEPFLSEMKSRNAFVENIYGTKLIKEELRERCRNLQIDRKNIMKEVSGLSIKLNKIVVKEAVSISSGQHFLLKAVIEKEQNTFEEGTPQWLLWQQQLEQNKKADKSSMKWHPLIIRWCLSIYHTSPAAYKQISSKRNNILILPHINTLKRYINFTEPASCFNKDVIAKLVVDCKLKDLTDNEKNVSLIFDVIKIKAGLTYRRSTGKLVGFTEMGPLNEEIKSLKQKCDDSDIDDQDFAKYVNLFMV